MARLAWLAIASGVMAALAGAAWAGEEPAPKILTLDQVPAPVRATIERNAAGTKVEAVIPMREGGQTVYIATAMGDKLQMTIRVAADGKFLRKDSSEELGLDTVPPAIREILQKEAPGAKVKELTRIVQDRRILYHAILQGQGKEIELSLDGVGRVTYKNVEENLTLDEVPAPVKAAILKETEGTQVERIVPARDEANAPYVVEARADEKSITLKVDAGGKLLDKVIKEGATIDDVPAPVKATIEREAGGGAIQELNRTTRNGKTVYEATLEVGEKNIELTVDPEGKTVDQVIKEDVTIDRVPAAVRETIQRETGEGDIVAIERVTRNGKTAFEAQLEAGGKTFELTVSPEGKVLQKKIEREEKVEKAEP